MRFQTLAWGILAAVAATTSTAQPAAEQAPFQPRRTEYRRLPLTFEINQGQSGPEVKFLSRGAGYTAFLTTGGMMLSLRASEFVAGSGSVNSHTGGSVTVQFALIGANQNPIVVSEDPQPGRVNYFFGNDPTKWHTNVPTFGRVRYKNVYPGIDLLYYGNHRQLEYDFEVQSGSDPRRIQFEIRGARQIELDPEGNLVLRLGSGEIHFQSPAVYQESKGQRTPVGGAYVMTDPTHIAFQVADYDSNKPLVIDPALVYSTYLGGSGIDQATGIAVDTSGSVYVSGYTTSVDFPLATPGTLPKNAYHVFVAKLDPAGANLIYADYIGGNGEDYGVALVLDGANEVYVTGSTASSNFPVVKAYQPQQPGPYAGFLTKVSADGSSLLYSTYLGGNTFDQPTGIAIDSFGQVHVAGYTASQNFPVANAYQSTASANQAGIYGNYGFLTKFSVDGSSLVYSTYLAGNSTCASGSCWPAPDNAISALALDANGNAYVAGTTNTYNFPVTPASFLPNNSTQQDASVGFVSKFTSAGSLSYSTYFYPASGNPIGAIGAIAVDGSGSAYITGAAESDGTFPITSTSICDPGVYGYACSYAFVSKLDPAGSTLLYSTFLGPNNYASGQALALDAAGDAYVVGTTSSPGFQTNDAIEAYAGKRDLLLVEIDPGATTQLFSTYLGGSGNDSPSGMALDAANNVYVVGSTDSTDFPVTQGAFQNLLGGNVDAFVVKIGEGSSPTALLSPGILDFAPQPLGSTSQPQQVQLRNMSSLPLTIASIAVTGDYAETDNCGTSVPAAGSCTLSVTFTPTAVGPRAGLVQTSDNGTGSPHQVSLEGSGLGAVVTLAPAILVFPSTQIATSSPAQTLTLANQGNATLDISSIQATGDFEETNNCPAALAAGASCTFNITFTPTAVGNCAGTLAISDSAIGSPHTVALSGAGSDFSLASSPNSATVKAGATATYAVTVTPVGGAFSSTIQLACSGAPAHSTCSVSPASATPGSNPAAVTVTVSTTASTAQAMQLAPVRQKSVYALWFGFPGFGLLGVMLTGSKCWRNWTRRLIVLTFIGMLLIITACAGGTGIVSQGQPGTPTGSYTIAVTGTSGGLQHSLPLALTVQ
ncbi:MAG: SBBP repeat-containing protein [Candidatus Sulfotelmatobacter sp.]